MAAKKHVKSGRVRRSSSQKVNAVSKASIRMLSPAYVMGIHDLSDDDSSREPELEPELELDDDDAYGGYETSESWSNSMTTATSTSTSIEATRHLLPVVDEEEQQPRVTAVPLRSFSSDVPRPAGNALGLNVATDYSRKMSAESVRERVSSTSKSAARPVMRITPGPAARAAPSPVDSQASTSTVTPTPTPTKEQASPNTLSFSRLFSWKRGNNKQSKTPPTKKSQLASPQAEAKSVPTSAPANVTAFAEAQVKAPQPSSVDAAPQSPEEKRQARFKAHLNDLYKSYALDNRYIGDKLMMQQIDSPPETANMSPYFHMPVSPNYATTPLPQVASVAQRGEQGYRKPVPTLREVRKATPSTIGQQHQAMMAQRYYDSSSSVGSYSALGSVSSSTPPRMVPVRGASASSIPASSSSSSSLNSPLRRVTSVGRGTRKGSNGMRTAPSFQLLPDFSFNNGPPKAAADLPAMGTSDSSSSLSNASDESDEPARTAKRRGQGQRRKRAHSQPRRAPPVPDMPAMHPNNALGIDMDGSARTMPGPPTRPPPPVPTQSLYTGQSSGQQRPQMRRRSKSFESVLRDAHLRPLESLTPTSQLSPTLESLVDDSDSFWPDFMTEELNLKRQQTQRNLAAMASRSSGNAEQQAIDGETGNEESVAKLAHRVTLSSHGQVVGVSSPRIVALSPRLSDRGSPNQFASAFKRPNSAMSTVTVRPQETSPHLQARTSAEEKRISTASTIRASSPSNLLGAPVVNVMPPTPDMVNEEDGFTGEQNSNPQIIVESDSLRDFDYTSPDELGLAGGDEDDFYGAPAVQAEDVMPEVDDVPEVADEQEVPKRQHERNISDISQEGTMSSDEPVQDDDNYSFVRTLSSISIASSSDESNTSSNSDLDAEVDNAVVESASIVNIRSPPVASARFSRAPVASPSITSLASLPSGTSLALAMFGSPPRPVQASPPRMDQTPGLTYASSASASSFVSSAQQTDNQQQTSPRAHSAMESRESMASMMTTSTSILDFGSDMVHRDSVFERINARAFGPVRTGNGDFKSPKEEALAAFSELHSPNSIQNILNYVNMAAPGGSLSEEDCDTPRLQYNGFPAFFQGKEMPQTRPLKVRKNMSKTSLVESASSSACSDVAVPSSASMAVTRSSPGQRTAATTLTPPASKSPYPRDEKTQSPNLELDLNKPLDLHNIGLGVEVAQAEKADKPRRRGAASKVPSNGLRARSKSNVDLRRPSIQQHAVPAHQHNQVLLASAMETPESSKAMGLGLDLSGYNGEVVSHDGVHGHVFGLQDSPENGCQSGGDPNIAAVRNSSKALRQVSGVSSPSSMDEDSQQQRRPFQPRHGSNTQQQQQPQKYQYYSAESYCENGIGFAM